MDFPNANFISFTRWVWIWRSPGGGGFPAFLCVHVLYFAVWGLISWISWSSSSSSSSKFQFQFQFRCVSFPFHVPVTLLHTGVINPISNPTSFIFKTRCVRFVYSELTGWLTDWLTHTYIPPILPPNPVQVCDLDKNRMGFRFSFGIRYVGLDLVQGMYVFVNGGEIGCIVYCDYYVQEWNGSQRTEVFSWAREVQLCVCVCVWIDVRTYVLLVDWNCELRSVWKPRREGFGFVSCELRNWVQVGMCLFSIEGTICKSPTRI